MVLPFTNFDVVSLAIFSVFYGLDWVATVPPTVTLTNEVFGKKDAPVIVSWIVAGHQIGGALAALGAGETRYLTGSYVPAFLASGSRVPDGGADGAADCPGADGFGGGGVTVGPVRLRRADLEPRMNANERGSGLRRLGVLTGPLRNGR